VVEYLLDDTQVRVSPGNVERFHHVKYHPRSPRQVEDGSQIEIEFNPAHQRLNIHYARVMRGGRTISALAARDVRVVQRERDLDQRIYDGTLTAVIFLRDVRVGDVVDYAFTSAGSDPMLGGKYVASFEVADSTFTAALRRRIVMPVARSLTVKSHGIDLQPKVSEGGAWREYLWERRDVAPIESDDALPGWFDDRPWVEASEFGSWAEVAALFDRLFTPRRQPSAAMAAEIARLRAAGATSDERLLEATRFVQDEIRYLGLEIGLSRHKPFEPSEVLARRFGDCKDKANLLVAMLGALGVPARAALVNTHHGRGIDDSLPSPLAFNHAIVEASVDGQRTFIDPTVSYQRGPLSSRPPPDFERALIVAGDSQGLVSIPRPAPTEPTIAVREMFVLSDDGRSADLQVETTLRQDDADAMRERLARVGLKELSRDYLNYYAKEDATVSLEAELQTTDDERRNILVMREHYRLGRFWQDAKREFRVAALDGRIEDPHIRLRKMPFALEFPLAISQTTIVRLPTPPSVEPDAAQFGDKNIRFTFAANTEANDLVIKYDLRTLSDTVAPENARQFFAVLDEIRERTGYVLHQPSARPGDDRTPPSPPRGVPGFLGFSGFIVVAILGVRRYVRSARRRAVKRETNLLN
jgi:transglutaminase-like putative cysteine protease